LRLVSGILTPMAAGLAAKVAGEPGGAAMGLTADWQQMSWRTGPGG